MISYIWNKIKNIFSPEKQDPHLVLYEPVEHTHKNGVTHSHKDGDVPHEHPEPCTKHIYYRKSCPVCRELRQAGII